MQLSTDIDSNHENRGSHQEKEHKREAGKTSVLKDLKYSQEKLQGLETTSLLSTFIVTRVKWGNKWITHWFPNSDATKRKPVLSTHMAAATGTVSKYLSRISVTWNGKRKILVCR